MKIVCKYFILLSVLTGAFVSCKKETGPDPADDPVQKPGDPIEVVDGKVLFYLDNFDGESLAGKEVSVNSLKYTVSADSKGRNYLRANVSAFGDYTATYLPDSAANWCNVSQPYTGLILPCGQFYGRTSTDFRQMPRFALYSETTGNVLKLSSRYAMIRVHMTGEGSLSSLLARSEGDDLTGRFDYSQYKGTVKCLEGVDFASLNCNENPTPINNTFELFVLPGSYSALKLIAASVDHKKCELSLGEVTLAAGDIKEVDMTFDSGDNLFYEGFDTFVWGGDIMGGSTTFGFAPDENVPEPKKAIARNGYSYAKTSVASCTTAGSSYFSEYSSTGNFKVMPDDFWKSRNVLDYKDIVRAQEYQGYILVSPVTGNRGWIYFPALNLPRMADVKISLDFCYGPGAVDDVNLEVNGAGVIQNCLVNGKDCRMSTTASLRKSPGAVSTLTRTDLSVSSSATAAKKWNHVELTVTNVSELTAIRIIPQTAVAGYHTFYVDNVEVNRIPGSGEKTGYRLLYWNILYGMSADYPSYDNFVSCISSYDPDVCVFCEARSKKGDSELPDGYAALAARWGHSNVAGTGSRYLGSGDGFPQEVTSRAEYTLEHVKNIKFSRTVTDKDGKSKSYTSHGAGLVKLNLGGRIIYVVPLHLVPGVNLTSEENDNYQEYEMEHILNETILSPDYADQKEWIILGDYNSHNPQDDWYWKTTSTSLRYKAQTLLQARTDLVDCVREFNQNNFMMSTGGGRIDFIYASPSIYKDLTVAMTIVDTWARPVAAETLTDYQSSDHRPLLIEIKK